MQALVGLFCFSFLLATGTCLECEYCSGFQEDCTGKLKLCSKDQDTCATILTETIIGKVKSFTVVKSCYQASKCLGSSNGNSFIKVNVNIECSSSPVGKIESEGSKALVLGSNELPDNQLLVKLFNRPKSRAAENPKSPIEKPEPPVEKPEPPVEKPEPPVEKPEPPVEKPEPPVEKPEPPAENPEPPTEKPKPPTEKPKPPTEKPKPPTEKPKPPTQKPKPPTEKPKPPTQKPTTGDAHQTVASFLLALSSLLLMNIVF